MGSMPKRLSAGAVITTICAKIAPPFAMAPMSLAQGRSGRGQYQTHHQGDGRCNQSRGRG